MTVPASVRKVAKIFVAMQQTRIELLGTSDPASEDGKIDILLAQMLEAGKDAMKDEFSKITAKLPKRTPV